MLAIIAVILFVLSAIQQLTTGNWEPFDTGLLNTLGFVFVAAHLAQPVVLRRREP